MDNKDYYGVLGVDKNASADEIKSAYRKMAKKYHPDVYATASADEKAKAEEKFKEVQHAYDVLSDPQKKAAFDSYGDENGPQGFGGGGFGGFSSADGFGDIFSDIFSAFTGGGRTSSNPNASRQGDDIEITMPLSFKEACFGVEKEITYSRIEKCSTCGGTGARNGSERKTCTKCGGRGRVVVNQRTMLGVMRSERVCDMCGGSGKIITDPCPDCRGKGVVKKQRTVKVKIPAGVDNGQMLTVQNEGNAGTNGGANGNLILVFRVTPHSMFTRDGVNLYMDYPITVADAIMGTTVDVPTLTGIVKVDIPEGTQDGTVIRVKGKGVKNLRKDVYGDLYVKVTIDVPRGLSSRQKKSLAELQDILKDAKYDKIDQFRKKARDI